MQHQSSKVANYNSPATTDTAQAKKSNKKLTGMVTPAQTKDSFHTSINKTKASYKTATSP